MVGQKVTPRAGRTETPNNTDQISDNLNKQLCKQLFNLRNGQTVELIFKDESQTPDYHQEGTKYVVEQTAVKHTDGEESGYYVTLSGMTINTMDSPHFRVHMTRKPRNNKWYQCFILGTTGTNKWGKKQFNYRKATLEGIVTTNEVECCNECGRPL